MPPRKAAQSAGEPAPPTQDASAGKMPLVEDLFAPELYATDAQSFSIVQGIVTLTFTSTRYDYSTEPAVAKKVVVGRVVMSAAGSQRMAVRLYEFLVKNGLGPKVVQ